MTVGTKHEIRSILDSDSSAYLVLTHKPDATTNRILDEYHVVRELGNKSIIGNRPLEMGRTVRARGSGD